VGERGEHKEDPAGRRREPGDPTGQEGPRVAGHAEGLAGGRQASLGDDRPGELEGDERVSAGLLLEPGDHRPRQRVTEPIMQEAPDRTD